MLKLMSLQLLICKILEKGKGMKMRGRKTEPNVPDILAKVSSIMIKIKRFSSKIYILVNFSCDQWRV